MSVPLMGSEKYHNMGMSRQWSSKICKSHQVLLLECYNEEHSKLCQKLSFAYFWFELLQLADLALEKCLKIGAEWKSDALLYKRR